MNIVSSSDRLWGCRSSHVTLSSSTGHLALTCPSARELYSSSYRSFLVLGLSQPFLCFLLSRYNRRANEGQVWLRRQSQVSVTNIKPLKQAYERVGNQQNFGQQYASSHTAPQYTAEEPFSSKEVQTPAWQDSQLRESQEVAF